MFKINDNLATHGIGEIIHPLPDNLSRTGQVLEGTEFVILDCRDMNDGYNPLPIYDKKIRKGVELLDVYGKVVICCGAGISRSNAIAIGLLVEYFGLPFDLAEEIVKETVPIAQPEPHLLTGLKKYFGVTC